MSKSAEQTQESENKGEWPSSWPPPHEVVVLHNPGGALVEFPKNIDAFTALEEIQLGYHQLFGTIPLGITQLALLRQLVVPGNRLTGSLPAAIGNLAGLEVLDVSSNSLEGSLPDSITRLVKLKELRLYMNSFTGTLPEGLGCLTDLTALDLSDTQIGGSLPESITQLTKLEYLATLNTMINGPFPQGFTALTQLSIVMFDVHRMEPPIPENVQAAVQRLMCGMMAPPFGGLQMPGGFGMQQFGMFGPALTGTAPLSQGGLGPEASGAHNHSSFMGAPGTTLGDGEGQPAYAEEAKSELPLHNSVQLPMPAVFPGFGGASPFFPVSAQAWGMPSPQLPGNGFPPVMGISQGATAMTLPPLQPPQTQYTVPPEVLSTIPQHLRYIAEPSNHRFYGLQGEPSGYAIPSWVSLCYNLHIISCMDAYASPDFLQGLPNLTQLTSLSLIDTGINQPLPVPILALTTLQSLNISQSGLQGRIPEGISALAGLTSLRLNSNELLGSLPEALGALTALEELDVSHNTALAGPIPAALANLTRLKQLDLAYTATSGSLPPEMSSMTQLTQLRLQGTQVEGPYPQTLMHVLSKYIQRSDRFFCASSHILLHCPEDYAYASIPSGIIPLLEVTHLQTEDWNWRVLSDDIGFLTRLVDIDLQMTSRPMYTKIPEELAKLTRLQSLRLRNVAIREKLPSSLTTLTNLQVLALSECSLRLDQVEIIPRLTALKELDLGSNQFWGQLPPAFGLLRNLEEFDISHNDLHYLPEELGDLSRLSRLDVSGTRVEQLPTSLRNTTALVQLLADDAKLSCLSDGITALTNLERISVSSNTLTFRRARGLFGFNKLLFLNVANNPLAAPEEAWQGLSSLHFLDATACHLEGNAGACLQARGLVTARLAQNKFTSLSTSGSLPCDQLTYLDLSHCTLNTAFPPALLDLTALQTLLLQHNQLHSSVPSDISELQSLTRLDLSNNKLADIPQELSHLTKLQILDVSENQIYQHIDRTFIASGSLQQINTSGNKSAWTSYGASRPLPSSWEQFSGVTHLQLSRCETSGMLSSAMTSMVGLVVLELSGLSLTGRIDSWIYTLTQLQRVDLSDNHVTGCLPEHLFKALPGLRRFNVENNLLEGPLPQEAPSTSPLVSLNLAHNRFTGSLPEALGTLTNLEELRLHNNSLRGTINPLQSLTRLRVLRLEGNGFVGAIPHGFGALKQLREFNAGGNSLESSIPSSIAAWSELLVFNVSSNRLKGEFPSFLLTPKIQQLYLAHNCLIGNITAPDARNIPSNLSVLDCSYNELTGPFPEWLTGLPRLYTIDLCHNHLIGRIPRTLEPTSGLKELRVNNNCFDKPWNPSWDLLAHITQIQAAGAKLELNLRGKPVIATVLLQNDDELRQRVLPLKATVRRSCCIQMGKVLCGLALWLCLVSTFAMAIWLTDQGLWGSLVVLAVILVVHTCFAMGQPMMLNGTRSGRSQQCIIVEYLLSPCLDCGRMETRAALLHRSERKLVEMPSQSRLVESMARTTLWWPLTLYNATALWFCSLDIGSELALWPGMNAGCLFFLSLVSEVAAIRASIERNHERPERLQLWVDKQSADTTDQRLRNDRSCHFQCAFLAPFLRGVETAITAGLLGIPLVAADSWTIGTGIMGFLVLQWFGLKCSIHFYRFVRSRRRCCGRYRFDSLGCLRCDRRWAWTALSSISALSYTSFASSFVPSLTQGELVVPASEAKKVAIKHVFWDYQPVSKLRYSMVYAFGLCKLLLPWVAMPHFGAGVVEDVVKASSIAMAVLLTAMLCCVFLDEHSPRATPTEALQSQRGRQRCCRCILPSKQQQLHPRCCSNSWLMATGCVFSLPRSCRKRKHGASVVPFAATPSVSVMHQEPHKEWQPHAALREAAPSLQQQFQALAHASLVDRHNWPGLDIIPEEVSTLQGAVHLQLSECGLTGPIPSGVASLTNLTTLNLSKQSLSGAIPDDIWQLPSLTAIDLSHNCLTGAVSSAITHATCLKTLFLHQNDLSEWKLTAPPPALEEIDVSDNHIMGHLCSELRMCQRLRRLCLHHNMFKGDLPPAWGALGALAELRLGHNRLEGQIPETWASMNNLTVVAVEENTLTGEPFAVLCTMQLLETVEISYNQFTGRVPSIIGRMRHLQTLELSHNNFGGELPQQLSELSQLRQLDVSYNKFSGSCHTLLSPPCAYIIHASHNRFSGPLPQEWSRRLDSLDLQHNFITGPLPVALLQHVLVIDVSNNPLKCDVPQLPERGLHSLKLVDTDMRITPGILRQISEGRVKTFDVSGCRVQLISALGGDEEYTLCQRQSAAPYIYEAKFTMKPAKQLIPRLLAAVTALSLLADVVTDWLNLVRWGINGQMTWMALSLAILVAHSSISTGFLLQRRPLNTMVGRRKRLPVAFTLLGLEGLHDLIAAILAKDRAEVVTLDLRDPRAYSEDALLIDFLGRMVESFPQLLLQLYVRIYEWYETNTATGSVTSTTLSLLSFLWGDWISLASIAFSLFSLWKCLLFVSLSESKRQLRRAASEAGGIKPPVLALPGLFVPVASLWVPLAQTLEIIITALTIIAINIQYSGSTAGLCMAAWIALHLVGTRLLVNTYFYNGEGGCRAACKRNCKRRCTPRKTFSRLYEDPCCSIDGRRLWRHFPSLIWQGVFSYLSLFASSIAQGVIPSFLSLHLFTSPVQAMSGRVRVASHNYTKQQSLVLLHWWLLALGKVLLPWLLVVLPLGGSGLSSQPLVSEVIQWGAPPVAAALLALLAMAAIPAAATDASWKPSLPGSRCCACYAASTLYTRAAPRSCSSLWCSSTGAHCAPFTHCLACMATCMRCRCRRRRLCRRGPPPQQLPTTTTQVAVAAAPSLP